MRASHRRMLLCFLLAMSWMAWAQQDKIVSGKTSLTGHYEGTAKNKAEEVITVAMDLTEKEGALTGTIHSSHGDFSITGGSRKDDAVSVEFEADGPGTMSLSRTGDRLVGTWSVGEDGGPVDVKKVAVPDAPKGKS